MQQGRMNLIQIIFVRCLRQKLENGKSVQCHSDKQIKCYMVNFFIDIHNDTELIYHFQVFDVST